MLSSKKIIVECKPDEILAKSLGLAKKEIAHQPNKGEVCNLLKKTEISLAIVDEDPNSSQPKYLSNFTIVEDKHDVINLHSKSENKTILVLKPRLEEGILKRCKESAVNPKKYFLPSNNKQFKDTINYHLLNFSNLLEELIKKNDGGLVYLKEQIGIVKSKRNKNNRK
ncbi:MAG: hypothetical protein A2X08_07565 [Bacteroidetes bacterium GWA2_32_17]|nr:MAG: hypothetical protein A2X08_07565 [Bacteroidetes bacterium GWA2_32_17]